jgi:hypothetical protein
MVSRINDGASGLNAPNQGYISNKKSILKKYSITPQGQRM